MRFFLDTANLDEIREAASLGVLAGVTTNPTLLARDGGDPMENLRAICEVVDGPVNAEVVGTDAETIVREGKKLRLLGENICVKIPMNKEGLKAVHALDAEGIDTTVTLIFNPQQALLAARAGATYVCPFVGRLDDVGLRRPRRDPGHRRDLRNPRHRDGGSCREHPQPDPRPRGGDRGRRDRHGAAESSRSDDPSSTDRPGDRAIPSGLEETGGGHCVTVSPIEADRSRALSFCSCSASV